MTETYSVATGVRIQRGRQSGMRWTTVDRGLDLATAEQKTLAVRLTGVMATVMADDRAAPLMESIEILAPAIGRRR